MATLTEVLHPSTETPASRCPHSSRALAAAARLARQEHLCGTASHDRCGCMDVWCGRRCGAERGGRLWVALASRWSPPLACLFVCWCVGVLVLRVMYAFVLETHMAATRPCTPPPAPTLVCVRRCLARAVTPGVLLQPVPLPTPGHTTGCLTQAHSHVKTSWHRCRHTTGGCQVRTAAPAPSAAGVTADHSGVGGLRKVNAGEGEAARDTGTGQ